MMPFCKSFGFCAFQPAHRIVALVQAHPKVLMALLSVELMALKKWPAMSLPENKEDRGKCCDGSTMGMEIMRALPFLKIFCSYCSCLLSLAVLLLTRIPVRFNSHSFAQSKMSSQPVNFVQCTLPLTSALVIVASDSSVAGSFQGKRSD